MLISRNCSSELQRALNRQSAVALIGARQVGKTTLALDCIRNRDAIYLDLQSPEDRRSLDEPRFFLGQFERQLVVLDEIHQTPELFATLRGLIDEGRRKGIGRGRFLILGSASSELLKQSGESLAGRIEHIQLNPFSIAEVGSDQLTTLWVRGGFPLSFLAETEDDSIAWRKNFLRTYIERDVLQFVPRAPTEMLDRLWTMLAHNQGATLNSSRLASSLEITSPTVSRYVGFLHELLLIRRLSPFSANVNKRLVKTPKIYVRDSGILHALLNLTTYQDVLRHPVSGYSWEGFVIEQIANATADRATPMFYRTADGAEIDLLLEWHGTGELWAIDIKRSGSKAPSRGFHSAIKTTGSKRNFVVCTSGNPIKTRENLEVVGIAEFLEAVSK